MATDMFGKTETRARDRVYWVTLAAFASLLVVALLVLASWPQQADAAWSSKLPSPSATAAKNNKNTVLCTMAVDEYNLSIRNSYYKGGEKYWRSQGQQRREEWCCDFVTYCAALAGLVGDGSYPSTRLEQCNVGYLRKWYEDRPSKGTVFANDGTYVPRAGDIAIRNWNQHVGIVASTTIDAKGTIRVLVIEGNAGDYSGKNGDRLRQKIYVYNGTGKGGWSHYITVNMRGRIKEVPSYCKASVSKVKSYPYTGKYAKPSPTVRVGGHTVSPIYTYSNNLNRGTGTAKVTVKAFGSGYKVNGKIPYDKTLSFSIYGTPVYRVFNPRTGEHLFTTSASEKANLVRSGWRDERIGWYAPPMGYTYTGHPIVHRLYHRRNGNHSYVKNYLTAMDNCRRYGYTYEGEAFKSGGPLRVYKMYNPGASSARATVHYTVDVAEVNNLLMHGWRNQGAYFAAC